MACLVKHRNNLNKPGRPTKEAVEANLKRYPNMCGEDQGNHRTEHGQTVFRSKFKHRTFRIRKSDNYRTATLGV
jgi:hypothetical protein